MTALLISISPPDVRTKVYPYPHMDTLAFPKGCGTCHTGHGVPDTPMLPEENVNKICLGCHSDPASIISAERKGLIRKEYVPDVKDIASEFRRKYTHPEYVKCTECHHQHRMKRKADLAGFISGRKLSPYRGERYEYELCYDCHSYSGKNKYPITVEVKEKFSSTGSSHPVERTFSPSPFSSLKSEWAKKRFIECTDCHEPHGSDYQFLLKFNYTIRDGTPESEYTYALCYTCHDRNKVMSVESFSQHFLHIVKNSISCASCHDPHGSDLPYLIRFSEQASPSSNGRLDFIDRGEKSGVCYVKCHNKDHNPEEY